MIQAKSNVWNAVLIPGGLLLVGISDWSGFDEESLSTWPGTATALLIVPLLFLAVLISVSVLAFVP